MKNQNQIKAVSLLLGVLALFTIITNPSSRDYESHEFKSFQYKYCDNSGYDSLGSIEPEIYKSICQQIVSSYVENPENLFALIRANSYGRNWIFLTKYTTNYSFISDKISKRVEQHPSFKPYNGITVPSQQRNERSVIGVFGNFFDFGRYF